MAKVRGIVNGKLHWRVNDCWTEESFFASEFTKPEAERIVRITNANNRFLDREDRVEDIEIVESR